MDITNFINPQSIAINITSKDKTDLITKLIDLAEKSNKILDKEKVSKAIFDREQLLSTGIGDGIAIPHAKTNFVQDTICSVAILKEPIDFESVDNKPVDIAFLLLGREQNVGSHLRILSKISRFLCDENRLKILKNCKTSEEVINLLKEEF